MRTQGKLRCTRTIYINMNFKKGLIFGARWVTALGCTRQCEIKLPGRASCRPTVTLQWRHNEHDSVSHHQPHDCLLNRLFRRRSKKISKLRVTGLCAGNSPGTGEFPAQMASYAENVSIWWRHHDLARVGPMSVIRHRNEKKLMFIAL